MSFLDQIFSNLATAHRPVLRQFENDRIVSDRGAEILKLVRVARAFIAQAGLKKGDRCALLAANSIRWAALDLALMAQGVIVVPLYSRQSPIELAGMIRDCSPALLFCGDAALRDAITAAAPDAPPIVLFEEVFVRNAAQHPDDTPLAVQNEDPVTIIYTSGTSGEPKGVVLNAGNLEHMLRCTSERLALLMGSRREPDQVFHYLPFCFAGSWIMLLTCLSRNAVLTISTDLTKLVDEIREAQPEYFLNVPTLLERVRSGITDQVQKRGGVALALFTRGREAYLRRQRGERANLDWLWLSGANTLVFPKIREKIGPKLKALICGSAPLGVETQSFFMMLGIPVLQVYGLTETTAICTMDDPRHVEPGKVGPAIPKVEMRLGDNDEILARGPNIFPGYWQRPQETAKALAGGWFHTGDQGQVDANGNWQIVGRIKNLLILNSGHNIAPEPIEEMLVRDIPGAQQVVLMGNGRGYVTAIVTGLVTQADVQSALDAVNPQLPHYKRVHAFHIHSEPFSIENGLLTANGKLKRDAIAQHLHPEIEDLYCAKPA
ncbi:MAG: AMP-binding protein [Acidobacteria bacterium]|nr:AMP-binding protein [Acidobacteriota bacterium]